MATLAALAALAACEQPTDPLALPPPRLVVHAVLDVGSPFQDVKVEILDGNFGHRLAGLGGAEVSITTPHGEVFVGSAVDNSAEGFHYHIANLGAGTQTPLVPGGTYTLYVRTQLGEEVRGTTTVPQYPVATIREDVPSLDRQRDTVRLDWERVPLAARYEVVVQAIHQVGEFQSRELTYRAFTDTSITIAGTTRTLENDEVFPLGAAVSILVSAVDDNYYSYYKLHVDPFAGGPPSRLTGAVGVFGAIAPVRRRSYSQVR